MLDSSEVTNFLKLLLTCFYSFVFVESRKVFKMQYIIPEIFSNDSVDQTFKQSCKTENKALAKARFRHCSSQEPNQINWIQFVWSMVSESIRNGSLNSDRLSRSRLAQPGITAEDRRWFRCRSSHEPNQFLTYFEDLSMSIKLCVSTSNWWVSLIREADLCSSCFPVFRYKVLAATLVNNFKINVHSS